MILPLTLLLLLLTVNIKFLEASPDHSVNSTGVMFSMRLYGAGSIAGGLSLVQVWSTVTRVGTMLALPCLS